MSVSNSRTGLCVPQLLWLIIAVKCVLLACSCFLIKPWKSLTDLVSPHYEIYLLVILDVSILEVSSPTSECSRGTGFKGSWKVHCLPLSLWCPQHSLACISIAESILLDYLTFPLSLCPGALYLHVKMPVTGLENTETSGFKYPYHKELRLQLCYLTCLSFSTSGTHTKTSSWLGI